MVKRITRGADKSLARPGRKQARKHVRDARDFSNIETRAVIKSPPPARQGAEGNSRHSDRNTSLFPSWSSQGLTSTPVEVPIAFMPWIRFKCRYASLNDGIRSEKCVVRRFRCCANVIECTYTSLDNSV